MKFKKIVSVLAAGCMFIASLCAFTGCSGSGNVDDREVVSGTGNEPIGDRTRVLFKCDANNETQPAWNALIAAYNDGQGLTDKVHVTPEYAAGSSTSPSSSNFTKSMENVPNVYAVKDMQDSVRKLQIFNSNSKIASTGPFLNLQPYADKDEDFQNNTINPQLLNWFKFTFNPNAKPGSGKENHLVGEGANLSGVPITTDVQFNFYNKAMFAKQGVNIINVPESELDAWNAEHNANVMPHGYAEYKEAPYQGAKSSTTLYGKTVYKVFNGSIGMNWEEMRNFLKYFTKTHNASSDSQYGFVSQYWFNYGWSVGGDVMGFNGTDYDFTLMDKSKNYIATKDCTVNGTSYKAGEIILYEDKVNSNPENNPDLYAIESQYNAIKEFVSLQRGETSVIDTDGDKKYYGYMVASSDVAADRNMFANGTVAMVRGTTSAIPAFLNTKNGGDMDYCVPETYREYEGGSVFYDADDGSTSEFRREHLKVIGETYEGVEYTGELKKVNGTPIVGNTTTLGGTVGLFIPVCSDPARYQAAWDFISWTATDGQEYIAKIDTLGPVSKDACYGDYATSSDGRNHYVLGDMSYNAGTGDWGYFESGGWVTQWANVFNGKVRKTDMTFTDFLKQCAAKGESSINNMYCVIKGIR